MVTPEFKSMLKIVVSFLQVLGSLDMFNVTWPEVLQGLISRFRFFQMDVLKLQSLSCLWAGIEFRSHLLFYTLGPLAMIAAFALPVFAAFVLLDRTALEHTKRWSQTMDSFWGNSIFFLFLMYPAISIATLAAAQCDIQVGLLMSDYRVLCPGLLSFYGLYSLFFFIMYPLGIPVMMVLVLRHAGITEVVENKLKALRFDAMIDLFIDESCSAATQRFARLVGNTVGNEHEFIRQCRLQFDHLLSFQKEIGSQRQSSPLASTSNDSKTVEISTAVCQSYPDLLLGTVREEPPGPSRKSFTPLGVCSTNTQLPDAALQPLTKIVDEDLPFMEKLHSACRSMYDIRERWKEEDMRKCRQRDDIRECPLEETLHIERLETFSDSQLGAALEGVSLQVGAF